MKNRNLKHSDEWYTPPEFYKKLNEEFNFDFDPCPSNRPEGWDGLKMDWGSNNYVNPPYSRKLKDAFVKKAIDEAFKGNLSVMLLPVSTSTVLFHDFIKPNAKEIRFLRKRIKFINGSTGEATSCGMHDSMIVVFDGRIEQTMPKTPTPETASEGEKKIPSDKYVDCNHHHELTDSHKIVDFGDGEFVANKKAIPLLRALNELGLKTRTHNIDNESDYFISVNTFGQY